MNNRRTLVIVLGACVSVPGIVFAQAKKPAVVIGWLGVNSLELGRLNVAGFKEGLTALDWKEGAQFVVEGRWADGRLEKLPALAEELKQSKPTVIVSFNSAATQAAVKAAPEIPVVQAFGTSPVDLGLAKSLARPGGMVTGLTNLPTELSTKYVELLLAAAPKLKRVGFLMSSTQNREAHIKAAQDRALAHYRVEGRFEYVTRAQELETAISRLAKEGVQGLVLTPSQWFTVERASIVRLALAHRWPVVAYSQSFAEAGALISYFADSLALCRRAAYYVDRILKGAKPGDLPIEQPTTFEIAVNMKTAKALALTMPPEIMVQATRVIQ